ncbi:MAG: hypothetical protein HRU13_07210, partial [Phycisphaerales bacterium]|nr:hypothetical protein [Phycisphaerales bacterium]
MTKARPIIFDGESVQAILEGRKTQTRRVVNPQPGAFEEIRPCTGGYPGFYVHDTTINGGCAGARCPFGQPGDLLWVRETVSFNHSCHVGHRTAKGVVGLIYRASWPSDVGHYGEKFEGLKRWVSPIHMPRWAARLILRVTSVRVERLQ